MARRRERAKSGAFIGMCDCGKLARRVVGGCVACDSCLEIDRRIHGSELARGVCGYVGYNQLARGVNA